ncbi:MAG: hypothetical protein Q4G58_09315 [bacterium]|nr:hypothetical protein [bacterium]
MNILDADFTLYQIEQTLEERFKTDEKMLRTIGDLDLTYEDYKYLVLKLKGISKYITKIEVFEQYKLSIITAMVFSVRYEKSTKSIYQQIRKTLNKLQQHQLRFVIRVTTNVFYELGLSTYGVEMNTINDILEVIAIHANLSKEEQNIIFRMLDNYYEEGEDVLLEEELYEKMNAEIHKAYPHLTHNTINLSICYLLKDLYASCSSNRYTLNQLLMQYNQLSKKLIEDCYDWTRTYSSNKNRLAQVR